MSNSRSCWVWLKKSSTRFPLRFRWRRKQQSICGAGRSEAAPRASLPDVSPGHSVQPHPVPSTCPLYHVSPAWVMCSFLSSLIQLTCRFFPVWAFTLMEAVIRGHVPDNLIISLEDLFARLTQPVHAAVGGSLIAGLLWIPRNKPLC